MRRTLGILGMVWAGAALAQGQTLEEQARRAMDAGARVAPRAAPVAVDVREQFLSIETIARMPMDQRRTEIPRLYTDLAPPLMDAMSESILSSRPANLFERDGKYLDDIRGFEVYAEQLDVAAGTMTMDQVADAVLQNYGIAILRVASRRRMIEVLQEHPEEVKRLIDGDLGGGDPASATRAFTAIGGLELKEYGDRLVQEYLKGGDRGEQARRVLLFMREPALAELLLKEVQDDPKAVVKHGGLMASWTAGKPADPVLLKLFDSPDPQVRLHAAIALEQSGDPRLAEAIPKVLAGGDERSIHAALLVAYNLPAGAFAQVRGSLVPLMHHVDMGIATEAVWVFAKQKDLAAGPVILMMLQLPGVQEGQKVRISQAMGRLTDQSFGYDIHNWGPGNPRNQKAIADFAAWLEKATAAQP